jgi:hypothetical protein
MKPWNPPPIAWATVSGLLLLSGCTGGPAVIKERGVYTTLAMEGQQLDLPASGYISCKTFGPGQNPVAIVVGYGFRDGRNNHPQPFDLEVVELASGTVVLNRSGAALPDRAAIIGLPLRKSEGMSFVTGAPWNTQDAVAERTESMSP